MVLSAVFVICLIRAVIGECTYDTDRYVSYRGCAHKDHNGALCGNWLWPARWHDKEFIAKEEALSNGVGNHNFCRNPGGKRFGVWCYRGHTKTKIYCAGVNDTTCVTRPEEDTRCPEATHTKSGTIETEPEPEITEINAIILSSLDLVCEEGCRSAEWESRTGLNDRSRSSNRLTINPVTEDTAGDWKCRCGDKTYLKRVTVCQIRWSECKQVKGFWVTERSNTCTASKITQVCTPPRTQEDNSSEQEDEHSGNSSGQSNDHSSSRRKESADAGSGRNSGDAGTRGKSGEAQAHVDGQGEEEKETCTGSECGFCQQNPLICGIIGCLAGAITVVAAIFVRKSFQWRKRARESQAVKGNTLHSNLTGSVAFSRHTVGRNEDYERALQIEEIVSQLGTGRRQPGLSCSTSVTDTMHLRHLRQHDQMGKIQSGALGSSENIVLLGDKEEMRGDHLAGIRPDEGVLIYQEEPAVAEPKRSTLERVRFQDQVGNRDHTLFDKYYDQDVDKWSVTEEVEI